MYNSSNNTMYSWYSTILLTTMCAGSDHITHHRIATSYQEKTRITLEASVMRHSMICIIDSA